MGCLFLRENGDSEYCVMALDTMASVGFGATESVSSRRVGTERVIIMDIPTRVIKKTFFDIPDWLKPPVSVVLGLFHLFPPCCIMSFTLAELGIAIEAQHRSFARGRFLSFLQSFESDYADEESRRHLCRFHAIQTENLQSYGVDWIEHRFLGIFPRKGGE